MSLSSTTSKAGLRKQMKNLVSSIPLEEVEKQSRDITAQVLKLPEFDKGSRIGVYLSMPNGEISTDGIVRHAIQNGKRVFVPHIQRSGQAEGPRKIMEMFALHSLDDLESLKRDAWGIPTLDSSTLESREMVHGDVGTLSQENSQRTGSFNGLDLILLPGMAFDQSNGRLGHGKGFYDYFLQRYSHQFLTQSDQTQMPRLVGLALKQQVLIAPALVPMEITDWKVDQVILGS